MFRWPWWRREKGRDAAREEANVLVTRAALRAIKRAEEVATRLEEMQLEVRVVRRDE
jgi:hypothetical protein